MLAWCRTTLTGRRDQKHPGAGAGQSSLAVCSRGCAHSRRSSIASIIRASQRCAGWMFSGFSSLDRPLELDWRYSSAPSSSGMSEVKSRFAGARGGVRAHKPEGLSLRGMPSRHTRELVDDLGFEPRLSQGQAGLQSAAPSRMRLSSKTKNMEEGRGIEPPSFRSAGFQDQWQTIPPVPSD